MLLLVSFTLAIHNNPLIIKVIMKAKLFITCAILGTSQVAFSQTALNASSVSPATRGVDQIDTIPDEFNENSDTVVVTSTFEELVNLEVASAVITRATEFSEFIETNNPDITDFVRSEIQSSTDDLSQIDIIGSFISADVPFEVVATVAREENTSIDIIFDGATAAGLTPAQIANGLLAAGFTQEEIAALIARKNSAS